MVCPLGLRENLVCQLGCQSSLGTRLLASAGVVVAVAVCVVCVCLHMDESFYLCQQGTGTDLAPLQYLLPFPSVPETGSLLGLFREKRVRHHLLTAVRPSGMTLT